MKKLYSLFAVAVLAFTANAQETKTIEYVFANQNFGNAQDISGGTIFQNVITYSTSAGDATNTPKYYTLGECVRFYSNNSNGNGNSISINSIDDNTIITDVKIYTDEYGSYAPNTAIMSVDGVNISNNIVTGVNKLSVYHFKDINGTTVKLQNGQTETSAQIRIQKIVVTFVTETQNVIDFATAKNSMLVKNTQVVDQLVFANEADVKVINMNGQVVKSATVAEGTSMNVSSLTPGMYIVTGSVNGKAVSQKIIKK